MHRITSLLLSSKLEPGRSYFVHLSLRGRLHYNTHLFILPILGYKIVVYFDPGLQYVLVQFFMVGTHELSYMCIFLERQRNKLINITFKITNRYN